jgi:hypothetical protein
MEVRGQEYQDKKTLGRTNLNLASFGESKRGLLDKPAQMSRKKSSK